MSRAALAERIEALLPQTQCRQCGYAGCRPYAQEVAEGHAAINQCPPGGEAGVQAIAALLGAEAKPLDPKFGSPRPPEVALIDEALCIGCTLCIQACPVDAIVGAAKFMHTVITDACTGCRLCLPPCPVDCIQMIETGAQPPPDERRVAAANARRRFEQRSARLARKPQSQRIQSASITTLTIKRALARARLRLAQREQLTK